jgi:hypothetical protein
VTQLASAAVPSVSGGKPSVIFDEEQDSTGHTMRDVRGWRAAAVLENVPHGDIAQSLFRMAIQQYATNSPGREPQIAPSPQAIHFAATQIVRKQFPRLVPIVRSYYWDGSASR